MKTGIELQHRIGFYLNMLTAIAIPVLPGLLPILLGLITINALVENNFRSRMQKIRYSPSNQLALLFFLVNIIAMLWTSNVQAGLMHLEIKASIALLPLVLFAEPLRRPDDYKPIRMAFVTGCLLSLAFCLIRATVHYLYTGENHFTYSELSGSMHPSYLSMYALFSMAILLFEKDGIFFPGHKRADWITYACLLLLGVFVLLLSSKINIFILLGGALLAIVLKALQGKNRIKTLLAGGVAILAIALVMTISPSVGGRIQTLYKTLEAPEQVNKTDTESNAARILVWKAGWTLFTKHPFFGVGTGDVNDELQHEYDRLGYSGVSEKRLNAHNQFLQSAIATGLIGLILLSSLLVTLLVKAWRTENWLLLVFTLLIFLNSLVEGILERQAGVVFFAFFHAWLLKRDDL